MYSKILVPIDGSECAKAGLREAARIADRKAGRVLLVHVIESLQPNEAHPVGTIGAIIQASPREEGENVLQMAQSALLQLGVTCEAALAESSGQRVAQVIVAHALRWNAELIVMGTHGRKGVRRMVLGSTAEDVIRTAPVPVLVVRHETSN